IPATNVDTLRKRITLGVYLLGALLGLDGDIHLAVVILVLPVVTVFDLDFKIIGDLTPLLNRCLVSHLNDSGKVLIGIPKQISLELVIRELPLGVRLTDMCKGSPGPRRHNREVLFLTL